MGTNWRTGWIAVLLATSATATAHAEGVIVLSANGGPTFPNIQAAVDAAAEGGVLVVAAGDYGPFTIDGKAVSIHAAPGATVNCGVATIRDLDPNQTVLLEGLTFPGAVQENDAFLNVIHCDGFVRFQDCAVPGKAGLFFLRLQPISRRHWREGHGQPQRLLRALFDRGLQRPVPGLLQWRLRRRRRRTGPGCGELAHRAAPDRGARG